MTSVRTPRSVIAAGALLEKFAAIDSVVAANEAARRDEISRVNARFDAQVFDILPQRAALVAALEAWWREGGQALTDGKRKSLVLGGCEIGSRKAPDTLALQGSEAEAVAALSKARWAKELVRVKVTIDRAAVLKSIDGAHAGELAAMGFGRIVGVDAVFIKRVEQGGTLGLAMAA